MSTVRLRRHGATTVRVATGSSTGERWSASAPEAGLPDEGARAAVVRPDPVRRDLVAARRGRDLEAHAGAREAARGGGEGLDLVVHRRPADPPALRAAGLRLGGRGAGVDRAPRRRFPRDRGRGARRGRATTQQFPTPAGRTRRRRSRRPSGTGAAPRSLPCRCPGPHRRPPPPRWRSVRPLGDDDPPSGVSRGMRLRSRSDREVPARRPDPGTTGLPVGRIHVTQRVGPGSGASHLGFDRGAAADRRYVRVLVRQAHPPCPEESL